MLMPPLVEAALLSLVPPPVLIEQTLKFGLANSKNATQLSKMTRAIPGQGKERQAAQHRSQRTIKPQSIFLSRACGSLPLSASASPRATSFKQGRHYQNITEPINGVLFVLMLDHPLSGPGLGARRLGVNLSHRKSWVRSQI